MGDNGGSGVFWGIVVASSIMVGFAVSLLAGYLIGHFTGHDTTTTVTVTAAQRPPDANPTSAAESVGSSSPITAAPAFSGGTLVSLPRDDWLTNGGSTYNQRYSPLTEIDDSNVSQLRGVWEARFDRSGTAAKFSGEATPIVYDGVVYTVTGNDDVFANAVEDGRRLWTYRSRVNQTIDTICCGWTNRGVAIGDGQVYLGRLDGRLVALDQRTGNVNWSYDVGDWRRGETITSAPLYYDGRVYSGVSGGEYGIRGRLTAVDAKTGRLAWRFYTIPGPGETGHETWPQDTDAWRRGGSPVWQTPAVDPRLGTLYFSTGNAAPDLNGKLRPGDNLFTASIVALDAATGSYKWHFQQVRHDIWDYDSPSPVVLWDARIDGREVKGLSQPSKTGWLYMLDRETGRPIHGITDRAVPQDKQVQATADTQPIPDTPAFAPHEISERERRIIQVIFDAQTRGRRSRRQRLPVARTVYEPFTNVPKVIKPGPSGANNWPPSSFNRVTNMVYICGADTFAGYQSEGPTRPVPGRQYLSSTFTLQGFGSYPGLLVAQDVTTGEIAWSRRFQGSNDACYSGTTTTAGNLVFVGRNSGELQAFDATDGRLLWRFQTGAGANSTPAIFQHRGRQMIAFYAAGNSLAGSSHGDSLWLFSLDGRIGPVRPGAAARAIEHAGEAGTQSQQRQNRPATPQPSGGAAVGRLVFQQNCSTCHGADGGGGNGGPSLIGLPAARSLAATARQVADGGGGLPPVRDQLTQQQITSVSDYVVRVINR
jgi:PQQ-dependent dehydrogenase (methanol/ethanol family)